MVLNLADYDISTRGFLPENNFANSTPHTLYKPWETIASELPDLIPGRIRALVQHMPLLPTEQLTSKAQLRWAYVRLAFIAQAYVKGSELLDDQITRLPPQLAVPFLRVSDQLGIPPTITYAATCLWNFRCNNDDMTEPDNIKSVITFTGTKSESWFYCISIAIEAQGANAIPALMNASEAAESRDYELLTPALLQVQTSIKDIISTLQRVAEKCNAETFYHRIRPFLAGSKNAPGLPHGVFFDNGCGAGEWKHLRGGSNGQSTLLQVFDKVLGIVHEEQTINEAGFHDEMKHYMPAEHRRFLEDVEHSTTIRENIQSAPASHEVRDVFNDAIDAMHELRSTHLSIVAKFIVLPSSKASTERLTGTGGTLLESFLARARDDTKSARV